MTPTPYYIPGTTYYIHIHPAPPSSGRRASWTVTVRPPLCPSPEGLDSSASPFFTYESKPTNYFISTINSNQSKHTTNQLASTAVSGGVRQKRLLVPGIKGSRWMQTLHGLTPIALIIAHRSGCPNPRTNSLVLVLYS